MFDVSKWCSLPHFIAGTVTEKNGSTEITLGFKRQTKWWLVGAGSIIHSFISGWEKLNLFRLCGENENFAESWANIESGTKWMESMICVNPISCLSICQAVIELKCFFAYAVDGEFCNRTLRYWGVFHCSGFQMPADGNGILVSRVCAKSSSLLLLFKRRQHIGHNVWCPVCLGITFRCTFIVSFGWVRLPHHQLSSAH